MVKWIQSKKFDNRAIEHEPNLGRRSRLTITIDAISSVTWSAFTLKRSWFIYTISTDRTRNSTRHVAFVNIWKSFKCFTLNKMFSWVQLPFLIKPTIANRAPSGVAWSTITFKRSRCIYAICVWRAVIGTWNIAFIQIWKKSFLLKLSKGLFNRCNSRVASALLSDDKCVFCEKNNSDNLLKKMMTVNQSNLLSSLEWCLH